MKSLWWLGLFVLVGLMTGSLLYFFFGSHSHEGSLANSFHVLLTLLFAEVCFVLTPTVAISALIRRVFGKLTGFSAGLAAGLSFSLAVSLLLAPDVLPALDVWVACQILGMLLAARIPIFRRKALELSPPSKFHGIGPTYAFAADENDSTAMALGRRSPAERSWVVRRSRPNAGWTTVDHLAAPPRLVPPRLVTSFLFGGSGSVAWGALALGLVASSGWYYLSRQTADHLQASDAAALSSWGGLVLALLSVALIRFAMLRLRELSKLVQLLRRGVLVQATVDRRVSLPGPPRLDVAVAETPGARLVLVTPSPDRPTERLSVLVNERGDVALWHLLPRIPRVDAAGMLTVSAARRRA